MCGFASSYCKLHFESVNAAVPSSVRRWKADDGTSVCPHWLFVVGKTSSCLFFSRFAMGSQRVKNASRSKVSQGDRACSEMDRRPSIRIGFL